MNGGADRRTDPYYSLQPQMNGGVSSDFLNNGSTDELAENTLNDKELLNQFKAIEKMADNDKNLIKTLIDAFITKRKVQQLAL
ncbi:MAG: hypothetical protein JXQ80_02015 [Bacteroidales bacterium]|nr:hypothetical protein [Bacteroidales bacterium]